MAECTSFPSSDSDSETKKTPKKMPSEQTDSYALLGAQIHPKFQIPRPSVCLLRRLSKFGLDCA